MASFSVALQSVVFLTLMAANSLESAKIFPSKDRISDINNDLWGKESNLVEDSEPTNLFWQVFEKPKMQKYTENYVKRIVKALHKFDSFHKHQQKTVPRAENQELKSDMKSTLIPARNGFQKSQSTSTDNKKELSSPIPPVVEDLSDIVPHLSPQIEIDKSQKFTHSIRYGYGKPPF